MIELRTRKERSLQFAAGIQTALQRAQAVPQPATGQQAFAGQVQTADGARAQGVTVRLASTINKVTKKIGEARTNQFGDFALNIPLCELTVPADATPDWQLVVEDAAGQTLASQEVSFDPAAGLVPFVPLTLNPPAAAPSAPAAAQAQPVVADKPKPADKPPAKPAKVSSKDPEAC